MEDLTALALPKAPVIRIVKDALDSQAILTKDLKDNLALAGTLFLLQITTM
jgi:histone H3/H4